MIPDLGVLFLYLALLFACVTPALFFLKSDTKNYIKLSHLSQFLLISLSFLCLIFSYISSDFSVLSVLYHSNVHQPFMYKIAASWSNHEGSMLLWTLIFSAFSCVLGFLYKGAIISATQVIQSIFNIFFIAFVLFFSNPFERIFLPLNNAFGLNPLLQDIGVVMHPPALYLGYIGFSVAYCVTIAGLLTNRLNKLWIQIIKPWVMLAWSILTIGILLGSWWAYRELGWGGFWFWDPVENASIIPWLLGTALIHGILLFEKTGASKNTCILLAILAFTFSMFGTFLVRSGLITSVHSFATDPMRGFIILGFVSIATIFALFLYAIKLREQSNESIYGKRYIFLLLNIIFFTVAAFVIILGTLYPLLLEIFINQKISVGAPYFNIVFNPMMIAAIYLCCASTYIVKSNIKKHLPCIILSTICTTLLILYFKLTDKVIIPIGIFGGLWLIFTMCKLIFANLLYQKISLRSNFFSMAFAHLGAGVIVVAIALNAALQDEKQLLMKIYEETEFQEFRIVLNDLFYKENENYFSRTANFNIYDRWDHFIVCLKPEVRFFPIERQQTTEAAMVHMVFSDLYITIGDFIEEKQALSVQIYYRPMMGWIWFGGFLIFLGGMYGVILSISQKSTYLRK